MLLLQNHLTGFGLGEQQKRAHDLREALDIGERVDDGVAVLIDGLGGKQRHFELAADHGDGRPELMRTSVENWRT